MSDNPFSFDAESDSYRDPADPGRPAPPQNMPGFVKGWMITEIVLGSLRFLLGFVAIVGVFGLSQMGASETVMMIAVAETVTHFALGAATLLSAIAILNRKRIGVSVAPVVVILDIMGMIIGASSLMMVQDLPGAVQAPAGSPESVGQMVGMACGFFIRVPLLIAYIVAVTKAKEFLNQQEPQLNSPQNTFSY